MLQPTRLKYRKQHKGRNTGLALRGNAVSFGDFALKAVGRGRLTARQIEAARRAHVILNVAAVFGFAYSRISQLQRNQYKFVWVEVRVLLNIMLQKLNLGKFSMRWMALQNL